MSFVALNARDGHLEVLLAGHHHALIMDLHDKGQEIGYAGPAIGILDNKEFSHKIHVAHHYLRRGERLVLTSDGVIEAADGEENLFGQRGVAHAVFVRLKKLEVNSQLMAEAIVAAARTHGPQLNDDVTVMVVLRSGMAAQVLNKQRLHLIILVGERAPLCHDRLRPWLCLRVLPRWI